MSGAGATRAASHKTLQVLFDPRSVAIVGASSNPSKLSGRPLPNLLRSRFAGDVFVVNPRVDHIDGVRAYPTLSAIDAPVDVAFIVLPAEQAVRAAREAADHGAAAAIIGVSGFAETGERAGRELQAELGAIAAETGMRIVGPNTNGIYDAVSGLSLGYNSAHGEDIAPGSISILSHSGAMFSVFAAKLRAARVGLSKFVAVGNESDLDMLDYLEHLVDDPATETIALLMEAIADGDRFKQLCHRATDAGKRIAVLKLGQSSEGARTTAAHSSRLAGSARSYEALFAQLGVASVETPEALIASVALATRVGMPRHPGRGLGVVTYSGAASSIAADSASRSGLPLASFDSQTLAALDAVPRSGPVTNPLDIGGVGGIAHSSQVFTAVGLDSDVRLFLNCAHILQTPEDRRAVFEALRASIGASDKPHVVLAPGGLSEQEDAWLDSIDVLQLADTTVCFAALAAYWRWADAAGRVSPSPTGVADEPAVVSLEPASGPVLSERESLDALDAAGVRTVERRFCAALADVPAAAAELGYPVVLKAVVTGVTHKSDLGLVEVGIGSHADLVAASARLAHNTAAAAATGFLLERMISSDLEVIAGVTHEPDLGAFLLLGTGGVLAEAVDDVALVPLPASRDEIRSTLAGTTIGAVLASPRWQHPGTTDLLVDALVGIARLATTPGAAISAVDVNPLSVSAAGVIAVDALIILAGDAS